jgi:hypothetical protein
MGEPIAENRKWSGGDTEAMFATVGRYVMIFQWVESIVDLILLLGWGHENWKESQAKLARLTNFEKLEAAENLVLSSPDFTPSSKEAGLGGQLHGTDRPPPRGEAPSECLAAFAIPV